MSITQTQQKALKVGRFRIQPGWDFKIPEVKMIQEDFDVFIHYWRKRGLTTKEAVEMINAATQRQFNTRWKMELRVWIGRKAVKYNQMFPHLKLKGFRPDVISKFFVPGRSPGGEADVALIHALTKMGELEEGKNEAVRSDPRD